MAGGRAHRCKPQPSRSSLRQSWVLSLHSLLHFVLPVTLFWCNAQHWNVPQFSRCQGAYMDYGCSSRCFHHVQENLTDASSWTQEQRGWAHSLTCDIRGDVASVQRMQTTDLLRRSVEPLITLRFQKRLLNIIDSSINSLPCQQHSKLLGWKRVNARAQLA